MGVARRRAGQATLRRAGLATMARRALATLRRAALATMARRALATLRRGALVALLSVPVLLVPRPAEAHAAFVSSDPPPGSELPSPPGVVVVRFSEPIVPSLSGATVTDPAGRVFRGRVTGEREVTVRLATAALGAYEVSWVTVSPLDGHTVRGSFRFGVGVRLDAPGGAVTGAEPGPADWGVAAARAAEYGALLLGLGGVVLRRVAARRPRLDWVGPPGPWVLLTALFSGAAVVLGEALVAGGSPSPQALRAYLWSGPGGAARMARLGAEAVALALGAAGRSPGPALVVAVAGVAASGHAAAVTPRWWGVAVGALHLLAAGVWAGGIMALALLRPPGGWRGEHGLALLARFSPVALGGFAATVGFGAVRGLQELSDLSDLLRTPYGRVLGVKAILVAVMAHFSALFWLRVVGSPRREAVLAGVVVALAAALAAYPLPPARVAEASAGETAPPNPALPRAGDLTLGDAAGEVLVGLTVRPGVPGPNDLLLYVLPLDGEEAAAGLPVWVSVGGRGYRAEACGLTCRRARLDLRGGERVEVRVGGTAGGTAVFELPPLPAPDGLPVYREMQRRMHSLRSYRVREVLSSGRSAVRADYAFEAPDRMRAALATGFERIVVGPREWRREGPHAPWRTGSTVPVDVPRFMWDFSGPPVGVRVVGRERLDGRETTVLSFAGRSGPFAVWYRLWVDRDGLVRRAEMRAQGHFMDHRYFAFDRDLGVGPPGP
jgi:copper transport protein